MAISFYSADVKNVLLAKSAIRQWVSSAVYNEGLRMGHISVIQCSNLYLLDLNKRFLKHHHFTDVITFPIVETGRVSGEIYISVEQSARQAAEHKHHPQKELQLLVIHGVMHLCGYSDKTKKQIKTMREKEMQYLNTRPEKLLLVSRETHGK